MSSPDLNSKSFGRKFDALDIITTEVGLDLFELHIKGQLELT